MNAITVSQIEEIKNYITIVLPQAGMTGGVREKVAAFAVKYAGIGDLNDITEGQAADLLGFFENQKDRAALVQYIEDSLAPKAAADAITLDAVPKAKRTEQREAEPLAEQIAAKFVKLSGHVIFFPRGTKRCTENGWEQSATNDLTTAIERARKNPYANVGLVGKQNGLWALDIDNPAIQAEIDRLELQHGPIGTYRTRTVSGGQHLIFRQNIASWDMGNVSVKDDNRRELLSARIDDRYVVLAGSWAHPHNDESLPLVQYTATAPDAPVIEAPVWLLDFIKTKAARTNTLKGQKSSEPAPDQSVMDGGRNNYLASVLGKMHQSFGWDYAKLREEGLRENSLKCVPPLPELEVEQIAASISKYDVEPGDIIFNQRPDAIAQENDDEETFDDDDLEEKFPECPIFTGALTDLARAWCPSLPLEFKQWGLVARWGLMRSGIDTFGLEPHLQPRFYSIFVCRPNRGKTACLNETRNIMDGIARGALKLSIKDSRPPTCAPIENLPSVDSGQFLAEAFSTNKVVTDTDPNIKIMIDTDEMSDVFEKGRTLNGRQSTLFIELLKLYSGNRTGSGTKKDGKKIVTNAHLAVLGGTTVKKYPMLWTGTGGGADGLVSRFIPVTTNGPQLPPVVLPTDIIKTTEVAERLCALAQLPPQNVVPTNEASDMLGNWWTSGDRTKESATRVLDVIKQLLIVLAVTNQPTLPADDNQVIVTVDLMKQAIAFGEYLIAIRERLNPADSWSHIQAMENDIIDWMRKHSTKRDPVTRNDCRRGVHPNRKPGGLAAFNYAWDSTVKAGVLKQRERDGKAQRYSI